MGRYTGPKRRLSRREGVALFDKDIKFVERKGAVPPGVRGTRFKRRVSEFGVQLREKQKAKRLFGLFEKQFSRIYKEAAKTKGATGQTMLELLESRLDNIVYRLGFVSSRMEARQIVTHGHVTVDGKKVRIPSLRVKPEMVVAISPDFVDNTQVKKNLSLSRELPGWLEKKATVGKMLRLPSREEMEKAINEQLIVEYYSR
ncbi:MAG: 30S ribosomal protein S4 [Candidatus Daviesbacteria bacterium GW2011_GWA2_38_24]|uniref:Small ribosomal subunit protein uS4 n=1 Tax=Candidatus Daviesbacteria bacterium GW2011_GWA2_38_24 TaxID=1618422 RepID=A0A0G0JWB1_9BACT|nr:MAG: 30S ribosomal protein S4 [Candidatus Daviesbacteria bacterium GW2011_GWA2_38_24]KKQ78359.1 MAG: 30S ribosomal protein S4 [Candidatus Daviesbacteria bacterium GW2011_GWA1_38_7]OGE24510.1 MAG: 30S ribosomal protein S4 [Candidatus Daviesbacteria bacterium RIFCSPHIGHO2_01_FULL_38_8]